ncbi:MAG: hypothetical protein ABIJ18_04435 [archaeon]
MARDNTANQRRLKSYMVDNLSRIGDFIVVDQNMQVVGPQYGRDIFLRDRSGNEYVIICHATPYPSINDFKGKILELGDRGIATVSVLFNDSNIDKEGNFFRWDRAKFKRARAHYATNAKRRQIKTRDLERFLNKLTDGEVVYFQPQTNNLRVVKFTEPVYSDYSHRDDLYIEGRTLKTVFDHEVVRDMDRFTVNQGKTKQGKRGRVILARVVPKSLERKVKEQLPLFF